MERIPESGYYNSNRFAKIFLESIKEIIGENGLNAILNYAKLPELIGNPPPDTLEKGFDFAFFSGINRSLEEIYGERGGRGIALRIGKATFPEVLKYYGKVAGVEDMKFKMLPMQEKIKFGLEATVDIFNKYSDQLSHVNEFEDHYLYQVKRCPVCWGRKEQETPICYYMVGLLKGGLNWASSGKEFHVKELNCIAQGHDSCEFIIKKQPIE